MEQGYERLSPEDLKASSSDYAFNRLCGFLFLYCRLGVDRESNRGLLL